VLANESGLVVIPTRSPRQEVSFERQTAD
jgi:hypothetical protein